MSDLVKKLVEAIVAGGANALAVVGALLQSSSPVTLEVILAAFASGAALKYASPQMLLKTTTPPVTPPTP